MKQCFILLICIFLLNKAFSQKTETQLISIENFTSKHIVSRNVDIWLPQGYSKKKKYAVLYMHDGQMLFDSTKNWNKQEWQVDETISRLMASSKIRDCIVVGIHNTKARHAEYFPQKPFESLPLSYQDSLLNYAKRNAQTGLFPDKVQSDNYLKFIVSELKPYIDKRFSTKKDRDNTFIAGSSMGGLVSIYALCEYPSVFGGAACLSTHWIGTLEVTQRIPDAFMDYLKACLPTPEHHKIYFDHGTVGLDALYAPFQKRVDSILLEKGYTAKNTLTRVYEGAEHNEKAWAKRLDIPIIFLLK
jgi:enterochelin esterase-like enzyme